MATWNGAAWSAHVAWSLLVGRIAVAGSGERRGEEGSRAWLPGRGGDTWRTFHNLGACLGYNQVYSLSNVVHSAVYVPLPRPSAFA